ncbi:MAG: FAD-binding domain-containing protein [Pseudomonadota bacterium]
MTDFIRDKVATRLEGLRRLTDFSNRAGPTYAARRNFDFGQNKHYHVSGLSPWIRHRLISEPEVIEAVLIGNAPDSCEKFVQEVVWRMYFKGWLEQRPEVWRRYRTGLNQWADQLDKDDDLGRRYDCAVAGKTGIDCFDAWTLELVETGYLHNHARMWFASIWVFTLELPWHLGADFFYRHLIDADPASNTLSWRWVCGLHTRGKHYLASAENIARFTEGRFNPVGMLNEQAQALVEDFEAPFNPFSHQNLDTEAPVGLLLTPEDCSAEWLFEKYNIVATLALLDSGERSPFAVSEKAKAFSRAAITDASDRIPNRPQEPVQFESDSDWVASVGRWARHHRLKTVITSYCPVGETRDRLDAVKQTLDGRGLKLNSILRLCDQTVWPHASAGFFKVKKKIPSILETLGLAE